MRSVRVIGQMILRGDESIAGGSRRGIGGRVTEGRSKGML